jgi:hypothetical protein
MIVMFYWPAQQPWVPLLATFGVGLLVQRYWVFAPRPLRLPARNSTRLLSRAISEISLLNDLLRVRRGLRKTLADKVSKGEATPQDYLDKTRGLDQIIKDREIAGMRARGNTILALNRGSGKGAWIRAQYGTLMALVVSAPWMVSYFWNLSQNRVASTNAYAMSWLSSILLEIGQWPALGFFFLFFYPHIRGRNGIEKGLTLTVALIAPALVGTILWHARVSAVWLSLLFWSLQAFICCMTIGVGLGDIGALRRAGKGPRSLVEIYNLGTLTAWSSSLAIAIGAAVTTALATQAGSLFSAGLKLLLPEAPVAGK